MVHYISSMDKRWAKFFDADFEAGTIRWRKRSPAHFKSDHDCAVFNTQFSGKIAGNSIKAGYKEVRVGQTRTYVHRIIWEMANGPIPTGLHIDHIDGNPSNNTLSNLRPATMSQNLMNAKRRTDNTSGRKGVCWHPKSGKWMARVGTRYIGLFAKIEDAGIAYANAAKQRDGEFSRPC